MANKYHNYKVDIIPDEDAEYNIGDATKRWVVNGYILANACSKDVTDNASSTAPSSTDSNLITGRTLYYAMENAGLSGAISNNAIDTLLASL